MNLRRAFRRTLRRLGKVGGPQRGYVWGILTPALFRPVVETLILFLMAANLSAADVGLQQQIPAVEYEALVDLYNSAGGPNWQHQKGWLDPAAPSWEGVTVSEGTVVSLAFEDNNLNGTIPESLRNLTNLRELGFQRNHLLRGTIPDGVGHLVHLWGLFLAQNQLSGRIPSSLGNLVCLQWLILNSNELSGRIPESLGNLVHLEELLLGDNQLSGNIPDTFGKLVSLRQLSLGEAMFSGHNQLSGEIPESLLNLGNLQTIDLSHNCFDICPASQARTTIDRLLAAGKRVVFEPQDGGCEPVFKKLTATPSVLWPPNHQMVPVRVDAVATGHCGPMTCKILFVTSSDPVNELVQAPDWEITGDLALNLRAERGDASVDRIYSIAVECRDPSTNTSRYLTVVVPRDQPGK
jgi:hypothetical protein